MRVEIKAKEAQEKRYYLRDSSAGVHLFNSFDIKEHKYFKQEWRAVWWKGDFLEKKIKLDSLEILHKTRS